MLYMEPLLRKGVLLTRFGYTDDIAFLKTGPTTAVTAQSLAGDVNDTLAWGRDNAVSFDRDKCELMHFSKRRAGRSDKVEAEAYSINPSPTALRWLGVFFDPKLSFKEHVTE